MRFNRDGQDAQDGEGRHPAYPFDFAQGKPAHPCKEDAIFVSVVVAARNEEAFIGDCLASLVRQTCPADRYEVVVADDDSEDGTRDIVRAFAARHANVRLVTPGPEDAGLRAKKRPMNAGIRESRGEILLTTDADCRVPPTWVASTVAHFAPDVGAVVGFSQVARSRSGGWVERLQGIDFLALMSAAAGALGVGVPLAASGQNLAYRRSLFEAAGGFREIGRRASGDDVLLLQLMRRARQGRIVFNTDPGAFVETHRTESLTGLVRQRLRWASNGASQARLNPPFFLYISAVFLSNLLIPLTLIAGLIRDASVTVPFACGIVKTLAEFAVLLCGASAFRRFDLLRAFPLWAALQPFYIVFVGLFGSVGRFAWKGRRHGGRIRRMKSR